MKENTNIPKFVSIIAIALGCLDLIRGFMHTILLDYAATNIAKLDLSTTLATDLLQLMGSFGISNYITGGMLIFLGWKARSLALTMLGVIPVAYIIGVVGIKINLAPYASSQAAWGGVPMMIYLSVCGITFIAGFWMSRK